MSDQQPPVPEPEHVEGGAAPRPGRRVRRPAVLTAAAVAVAGVVGVGGWAAASLMSTGDQPAEVVPAEAVGYLSIDLDPSAAQKVEAVGLLQKFPALRGQLDASARDDLRRWAFEQVSKDGACAGVDYDADVEPWIGDRLAVAAVPSENPEAEPFPLMVVQVTDADAAEAGIEKLAACHDHGDLGLAVVGEYALVSDTQAHADDVAGSVGRASLAEDADYRRWTERAGEPGIASVYLAPVAAAHLSDVRDRMARGLPGTPDLGRQLERLSGDFEGMAGSIRIDDGALEAELVGEGIPDGLLGAGGAGEVAELPAGTAVALGVSLTEGWTDSLPATAGLPFSDGLAQLLGDGFAVAVDGAADPGAVAQHPTRVPAGLRISGDPGRISEALDLFRPWLGTTGRDLVVEEGDGAVAVGLDREVVTGLVDAGDLGAEPVFPDVVPELDRAGAALFVDLDTLAGWAAEKRGVDRERVANLEPLRALGLTVSGDGDGDERVLLRLTTD